MIWIDDMLPKKRRKRSRLFGPLTKTDSNAGTEKTGTTTDSEKAGSGTGTENEHFYSKCNLISYSGPGMFCSQWFYFIV